MAWAARIVMPATAKSGEIVEVKTIVQHPMETGYRRDHNGAVIPRDIVKRFAVTYAGNEVFSADLTQGVAANPFFAFQMKAATSGDVVFAWTDEKGETTTQTRKLTVK